MRRLPRAGEAGTKGVQGPNLDLAFIQSIRDGLGRSTIEGVVRKQISLPEGGQMPADLVKGDDADSVAAYVANAVGKPAAPGAGGPARPRAPPRPTPRTSWTIPTDPTGQLAYKYKSPEAKAGKVTLESQERRLGPARHRAPGRLPAGRGGLRRQDLEDHGQPQARQLHLLLQRPRPRAGRDEGHAHVK